MSLKDRYPKRIICLTEETTETLYLLGEQDRIVGISGFTVRPIRARKEKPKVSTFIDAQIDNIIALKPDLVIGFSDIQADIAQELIKKGITVWVNNYRSVEGILDMIAQLGRLIGKGEKADQLIRDIENEMVSIKAAGNQMKVKPKVYFEEWFDPIITSIQWVAEIIEIAGGEYIFPDNMNASLAKDRILATGEPVIKKNPDIILASWCGKKFKKEKMLARPNWNQITAVKNNEIYEIDSSIILQPGPASVTEGLSQIHQIIQAWHQKQTP
ncbi:MAG: cobalamin-binding protein [Bacteroidota bacterium]